MKPRPVLSAALVFAATVVRAFAWPLALVGGWGMRLSSSLWARGWLYSPSASVISAFLDKADAPVRRAVLGEKEEARSPGPPQSLHVPRRVASLQSSAPRPQHADSSDFGPAVDPLEKSSTDGSDDAV